MLDSNGLTTRLRRTNWWCEADLAVTASAVNLIAATDNTQIKDNFQYNGLDLICANPSSDLHAKPRCDYELWSSENGNFLYLACSIDSRVLKGALRQIGRAHV